MYACMYVCLYVCLYECMYVCMYACMYLCMYVCIYVCMLIMYTCYVHVCIHPYVSVFSAFEDLISLYEYYNTQINNDIIYYSIMRSDLNIPLNPTQFSNLFICLLHNVCDMFLLIYTILGN